MNKLDTPLHEKRPSRKFDGGLVAVTGDDRPEGIVGEYLQTIKNNKKSARVDSGDLDRVPRGGSKASFKYSKTGSLLENTTVEKRVDEIEMELEDEDLPDYRVEELLDELAEIEEQLAYAARTWGLDESTSLVNETYSHLREGEDHYEDVPIDEVIKKIDDVESETSDGLDDEDYEYSLGGPDVDPREVDEEIFERAIDLFSKDFDIDGVASILEFEYGLTKEEAVSIAESAF